MTINNTAPLKIILFGEHAVTRGKTCIAVAINILADMHVDNGGVKGSITATDGRNITIDLSDIVNISETKYSVSIKFSKSFGCGLGSSAAVSVLLARFIHDYNQSKLEKLKLLIPDNNIAITNLHDLIYLTERNKGMEPVEINTSQNEINIGESEQMQNDLNIKSIKLISGSNIKNDRAFIDNVNCIKNNIKTNENAIKQIDAILNTALQIENKFHDKSSGVDVTASFVTGMIAYKNYSYVKMNSMHLREYKILIYDSKIMKNTGNIISKMIYNEKIYDELNLISEEIILLFQRRFKLTELYYYIRKNQDLLEELGIVPESMKNIVKNLRLRGIESKITGAGFGGHLFTVVDKNEIIAGWEEVSIYEV
ncbi:hypothetical protein COBT_000322 [Conglomerata obtusa]